MADRMAVARGVLLGVRGSRAAQLVCVLHEASRFLDASGSYPKCAVVSERDASTPSTLAYGGNPNTNGASSRDAHPSILTNDATF